MSEPGFSKAASVAVLAVVMVAAAQQPTTRPTAPKLVCERPVIDVGTMGNTQTLRHTFVLRNAGAGPLKILRIATCKACTNPDLSRDTVPPGETAELSVAISLYDKAGPFSFDLTLHTNDPARRRLRLELVGAVETWVEVDPLRVSFQRTPDDEVAARSVEVRVTDTCEPFAITSVEPTADWLTAETRTVEQGRVYYVTVRTKPPMPRGWHEEHVRLKTDSETVGTIDIPVRAMIVGELVVWPDTVSLIDMGHGGLTRRQVSVLPGKVKEFEILSVQPPVPMDVKIEKTGLGGDGRRIRLSEIRVSPELDGKELIITTDVEGMRTIRVPFEVKPGRPCPSCP
jgi:hypothetical protein